LLGLDKGFQIFSGERGKRNLPSFLEKDKKSVNPGKNGSEGASAYISPMEGLKVNRKSGDRRKICFAKLSKNPGQNPLLPCEIMIPDKKILFHGLSASFL
jgi:hypothetical protein